MLSLDQHGLKMAFMIGFMVDYHLNEVCRLYLGVTLSLFFRGETHLFHLFFFFFSSCWSIFKANSSYTWIWSLPPHVGTDQPKILHCREWKDFHQGCGIWIKSLLIWSSISSHLLFITLPCWRNWVSLPLSHSRSISSVSHDIVNL